MSEQAKISTLWLMLVVCLALHFNYNLSDHFCGIANNIDPTDTPNLETVTILMKTVSHILPLLFPLFVMFIPARPMRLVNLVLSFAYTLFHSAHFISQLSQEPVIWIQVELLALTVCISIFLSIASWNWWKEA